MLTTNLADLKNEMEIKGIEMPCIKEYNLSPLILCLFEFQD